MANAQELKSDYDEAFEIKRTGWERQLQQGMTDLEFYFRAQYTEDEARQAEGQNRELYVLDKIGRQVNLLHGYEIRNRHILKIGPQGKPNPQEDRACSQHTSVIMNLMVSAGGYDVLSEAFKWGSLVQGSNLIEIWRDREGDLQFSRLGWNQFLLNPGLTKTDLSDCQDIAIGRWIDEDRVKFLLPQSADDLKDVTPLTNVSRWDFLDDPVLQNKAKRMLMEEWWQRKTKFEQTVISRKDGTEIAFKDFVAQFAQGDKKLANRAIDELRMPNGTPLLSKFSKPVDEVKLTVFVNNRMVFDGLNPLKADDYNFVWVHGDWCAECPRDEIKLQSWSRKLRDPQRAQNRRVNQILDILESQAQALRVVRSKHITNPEDAHKSGQGIVLHLKDGAPDTLGLSDIFAQFPASEVPQGMFAALEMVDKAETETGGLNQEIFGSDDTRADTPTGLSKFRTGQALTGQAGMFQGFRNAKAQLGRKLVRLVQLNYPPQKVEAMINEQVVPGFYEKNLTRFDCTPIEGLLTESQQSLFYEGLKELRREFPNEAHKIPLSELVNYWPGLMKPELIEMIGRAEKAEAEQGQKQQQIQAMAQQLEIERVKGEIMGNRGIAEERRAQAVENISDAALNRVKTMAEIQDIGEERLLALAQLGLEFEKVIQLNQEVKVKS